MGCWSQQVSSAHLLILFAAIRAHAISILLPTVVLVQTLRGNSSVLLFPFKLEAGEQAHGWTALRQDCSGWDLHVRLQLKPDMRQGTESAREEGSYPVCRHCHEESHGTAGLACQISLHGLGAGDYAAAVLLSHEGLGVKYHAQDQVHACRGPEVRIERATDQFSSGASYTLHQGSL
mmetsp:Transcript_15291/g.51426  ORF Transcript_15291/g.51426 Transcript_15291/m.51426 type:complete len:177 (-) Transcript_15291:594-1124(-)